jgi:hypothetical protein
MTRTGLRPAEQKGAGFTGMSTPSVAYSDAALRQPKDGTHSNEDKIVGVSERVESFTETKNHLKIPVGNFGESNIGADELQMLLDRLGMHDRSFLVIERQDVCGKYGRIVEQPARQIPLGIIVDREGVVPARRQTLGKVQGNRGFPYSTFLIGNGNSRHAIHTPVMPDIWYTVFPTFRTKHMYSFCCVKKKTITTR